MPARQTTPPSSPACCQHPPLLRARLHANGGVPGGWGGALLMFALPLPLFLCSSRPCAPHPPLPHVQGFAPPPTSPHNQGILGGARKVCAPSSFSSSPPPLTPKIGQQVWGAGSSSPVCPLCAPPLCAPCLSVRPHLHAAATHNEGQHGNGRQRGGARTGGGGVTSR